MELNSRLKLKKTSNGLGFYIFTIILTMYFVSIVFVVAAAFRNAETENPVVSLVEIIASLTSMFIIGIFYCLLSNTRLNEVVPLKKVKPSIMIYSVLMAFALAFVSDYFTELFVSGVSIFGLHNNVDFSFKSKGVVDNIFYIISVAIIPPISEEFAFRGIILNKLRKYGDTFAILISALMFGLIHGNIVQIPFAFIIGLVAGFITVKTGSIIPAMITHFLVNCSSVVISIIQDNHLAETSITDGVYAAFMAVVIIAGIFAAYKLSTIKGFFSLDSYTLIPFKERIKTLFSTVGFFLAFCLIAGEVVLSLLPNGS